MPFPLVPIILGVLGAGAGVAGAAITNKQNRRMVQNQMDFQERMSSTAAQRSVEDYTRAGLNPALAYDRTASSPGGASTTLDNVVQAGVSNARDYQMLRMAMQQNKAELKLKEAQTNAAMGANERDTAAAQLSHRQAIEQARMTAFQADLEPSLKRYQAAQALLSEYDIPGKRNTAAFESKLGMPGSALGATAKGALELLKIFRRY